MVLGESEVGYDGLPELPPNWEYNKPDGVDGPPAPAAAEVPLAAAAPPDSSPDQSVVDARTPQEQQCDGGDEKSGQLLLGLSPPEKLVSDSEDEYFHWTPPHRELSDLSCPLCQDVSTSFADLETHYHQYHVNPRFLSQIDVKLFKLSNFLVKEIGDPDCESKYPGLYRCHECFNTFSQSSNLKLHLVGHRVPVEPSTVQMAPKTEHASPPGLANNNITVDNNKKKSLHNGSSRTLGR